ncbi:Sensor protein KdpD [Aquimixticola soesokkakensis]|uniref:histidine kinase n=1 Tax=Aquimixticola soesokkakensis TaxID=1519096 RepID=A0A1Y5TCV3_9RHOB|nr:ATP-binding protein [Aquimixticola soesokkakensis]SLN57512.1 Sensor protein KdpD [Aquimixticola soesokkakensis]
MAFNTLVSVCFLYACFLFAVAFWAEKRAERGRLGWLRSPLVYTLSLSVYCTAWTFYGAVGYAARSGLEFATIYIGPTLVMVGWWWILRKLVRIGRTHKITSVADLISSRYGKSTALGVIVTLFAVIGTTPYIALQLQSVTQAFGVFASAAPEGFGRVDSEATGLYVAGGLALFTILFGTRNLDANERHHGVVIAIALEAVVKLVALLGVGIFTVWGVAGGFGDVMGRIEASGFATLDLMPSRMIGLTFLAAAAFLTLPRMFQVLVVENADERHLYTAAWAFPLYVMLMSLFVLPIAVVGLQHFGAGANPDMFVLTLPLDFDRNALAMLSFLGGFSSATSMVIVAAIALSTMVSNHIVLPVWLSLTRDEGDRLREPGDLRALVLMARRLSILGVLALGYLYFQLSGGSGALAAIGLVSFSGVAQVLPAMLGGIFWRGATRTGALAGLVAGFAIWAYTLFLPSFGEGAVMGAQMLAQGPFGITALRPQALFGLAGIDPVVHAVIWSMLVNTGLFVAVSLVSFPDPIERMQGAQFVNVFDHSTAARSDVADGIAAEDLLVLSQRILGPVSAQDLFQRAAAAQGNAGYLPDPTRDFLAELERELAGSVGAATAHAMLAQITGGTVVSVEDLMAVAGETAQIMEYSAQLEAKSAELARTARALRQANEKLTLLSIQKDGFLSQISHELRTPMTSIRAFSEILREGDIEAAARARYAGIIHTEAQRLTRLLDDLLDLSVLESGTVRLNWGRCNLHDVIERAVQAALGGERATGVTVQRAAMSEHVALETDADRLAQVFINLVSNAAKYCNAPAATLRIATRKHVDAAGVDWIEVDFIDNGQGIAGADQAVIFEKFSRAGETVRAGGAGLGLAICREIMSNLGGTISYVPGQGGAAFRVALPRLRHDRGRR